MAGSPLQNPLAVTHLPAKLLASLQLREPSILSELDLSCCIFILLLLVLALCLLCALNWPRR